MLIMFPAFYIVIIGFSLKIRRSINKIKIPRLREYNKQVSPALFFQVNFILAFFSLFSNILAKNIKSNNLKKYAKNAEEYFVLWSKIYVLKAVLPTFEVAALCLQILTPALFVEEKTVFTVIFSDVPIHLAPFLNPLGTILLIGPYRRSLFKIFQRFRANSLEFSLPLSIIHVRTKRTASLQPVITTT